MKKLLSILVLSLLFEGSANAGFILENCKNADTGIKYKNKIFIVSDIGEQKILEIDNEEKTSLIIYNLETYNFDKAEGISVYEKSRIIVDAKNKSVEISYPSGSVWKYSCSKLK
tara:strand:- start:118 stop:459 length:342 start_codon:yes stop_codon:yes gene_type:complete